MVLAVVSLSPCSPELHHSSSSDHCSHSIQTWTLRPRPLWLETFWWHHKGPMEEWKPFGTGCYLCGHLCSTYAPSHLAQSTMAAGAVTSQAEDLKKTKNSYLEGQPGLVFTPVTVETSRVLGPLSLIFLKELSHRVLGPLSLIFLKELSYRVSVATGDIKNYSYLLQCLSVAIQRWNAASIRGILPSFDLYSVFMKVFMFHLCRILVLYICCYSTCTSVC